MRQVASLLGSDQRSQLGHRVLDLGVEGRRVPDEAKMRMGGPHLTEQRVDARGFLLAGGDEHWNFATTLHRDYIRRRARYLESKDWPREIAEDIFKEIEAWHKAKRPSGK